MASTPLPKKYEPSPNNPVPQKDGQPNHPMKDGQPNSPKKNQ
jgi:hypothetical protein